MNTLQPKKIFVEKDVIDSHVTRQILNRLPDITVEYIDDYRHIKVCGDTTDDIFKRSKEYLAIASKKGSWSSSSGAGMA